MEQERPRNPNQMRFTGAEKHPQVKQRERARVCLRSAEVRVYLQALSSQTVYLLCHTRPAN